MMCACLFGSLCASVPVCVPPLGLCVSRRVCLCVCAPPPPRRYALSSTGLQAWNYTTNDMMSSTAAIANDGTLYIASFSALYAFSPS